MASIQIIITYTFKNVLYVMKKIILSGGWSYGNLGDEAILISSINLIHQKYRHRTVFAFFNVWSGEEKDGLW